MHPLYVRLKLRASARVYGLLAAVALPLLLAANPLQAIVTADVRPDTGSLLVINLLTGADRFYQNGYYGGNTLITNVDAGHVWDGHETLGNVSIYVDDPSIGFATRQYDSHATAVGFTMVGLGPYTEGAGYYYYQFGMAPGATLASTAIATNFVSGTGEFEISTESLIYGYKTTMQTGVSVELWPGITYNRRVDVVNSSWGFTDPAGHAQETMIIDALAYANRQTVVVAAGNHEGTAREAVTGPASGFNNIAVGALDSDLSTPAYNALAPFSNTGPNDFYNPATGVTTHNVRSAVSICAPGTGLILAAYSGTTGSNTGGTDDFNGAADLYYFGASGTSFASPIVAGGAALLVDAGWEVFGGGYATDGRVIKAVLLNSAMKLPGWTNHSSLVNGVYTTTQALDFNYGAGALNLNQAYDQYLSGTKNVSGMGGGTVADIGWDYGQILQNWKNDYTINRTLHAGENLTVTLAWFVGRVLGSDDVATDTFFDQLDLQVWRIENGLYSTMVAESITPYDNVQHVWYRIAQDGTYGIRVRWMGQIYDLVNAPNRDDYGLAWAVTAPEPCTMTLIVLAAGFIVRRRRR